MKKIAFLLALLMLTSGMAFTASALDRAEISVDGLNVPRGENKLIVYNMSGTNTGTNQYGYEVRVGSDGKISSVGGNDSVVPEGGLVLSGHGTAATFLRQNAKVGRYARFLEHSMMLIIDDSYIDPFFSTSLSFDGINTGRAANTIIIYNRSGQRTNTNEYGFEVLINSSGILYAMGGNNNYIPSGGFVVSAHGTGADALRKAAAIGMYVSYDTRTYTVTFSYNVESVIYATQDLINKIDTYISDSATNYMLIGTSAASDFNVLKNGAQQKISQYRNGSISAMEMAEYAETFKKLCDEFIADHSESNPIEYRGVWIRPVETNESAVRATVQKLYGLGINMIAVESLYDCCTIFPTPDDSGLVLNPKFNGFDVLDAYVRACHEYGIELHVWMPVFCMGSAHSSNAGVAMFTKHPDWMCKNQNGTMYDANGGDYIMLDPSCAAGTQYLLDLYRYVITNYDIDCFQLDYIRYLARDDLDWGYYSPASDKFQAKYGFAPSYSTSSYWWGSWVQIRCDYVTEFVRRARALINEAAPRVLLSADTFAGLSSSKNGIYQDPATWIQEELLDLIHPMTYGSEAFSLYVPDYRTACVAHNVALVPGVGTFENEVTTDVLREQIMYARSTGIYGTCIFESTSYVSKGSAASIIQGVYRDRAPSLLRDKYAAVEAIMNYLTRKIELIYADGGYSTSDYNTMLYTLEEARSRILGGDPEYGATLIRNASGYYGTTRAKNAMSIPADMFTTAARLYHKVASQTGDHDHIPVPHGHFLVHDCRICDFHYVTDINGGSDGIAELSVSHVNRYNWNTYESLIVTTGTMYDIQYATNTKKDYVGYIVTSTGEGDYKATGFIGERYDVTAPSNGFIWYVGPNNSDYSKASKGELLDNYFYPDFSIPDYMAIDTNQGNAPKAMYALKPSAASDTSAIAGVYDGYGVPTNAQYEGVVMGDVDKSGKVTAADYLMVKRHVLGTYTIPAADIIRADLDFDEEITPIDYLMTKRIVLDTWSVDPPEVALPAELYIGEGGYGELTSGGVTTYLKIYLISGSTTAYNAFAYARKNDDAPFATYLFVASSGGRITVNYGTGDPVVFTPRS